MEILPQLYGRVVTSPTVATEMSHPNTPKEVRDWMAHRPTWLEVKAPAKLDLSIDLDSGEREAICLARELRADLLLVDDHAARQTAIHLGLVITGTLGVLELAASRNLVQLAEVVDSLRQTDFRVSEVLLKNALQRAALRQKPSAQEHPKRKPGDLDFER